MLEFTSQIIASNFPASQELWNTPSKVCSIAACGWAYIQVGLRINLPPEVAGGNWWVFSTGGGFHHVFCFSKRVKDVIQTSGSAADYFRLRDYLTK